MTSPCVDASDPAAHDRRAGMAERAAIALVYTYQVVMAPLTGGTCRFTPSCSAYAIEAIHTHGAARGAWLAVRRVARCHPWGGFGHDPVPATLGDHSLES